MSDPFGALATQRPGDIGIHIGQGSWGPTSGGYPVVTSWRGQNADPHASTQNPSTTTHAGVVEFVEGSAAHPVTAHDTATVMISRRSAMTVVDDSNAALWVNHVNNGATQPVAVQAYSENIGSGDAVGYYGRVGTTTGRAYGWFSTVAFTGTGGGGTFPGAIGLNPYMINGSGVDATWDGGGGTPFMAGLFYQAFQSAKLNGAGIHFTDNSNLDIGIGFKPGSVVNATFYDGSSSNTSISIGGAHTTVIDISGATASSNIWLKLPANAALGAVAGDPALILNSADWWYTTHVDHYWRLYSQGVQVNIFATGTPGANKTNFYLMEGATPTLRQVTTFDPGAAGINFTAGQLVCVAV